MLVGLSTGSPPKLGLSPLGTVHETVLGHLLSMGDSQRDSRESILANHSQSEPLCL